MGFRTLIEEGQLEVTMAEENISYGIAFGFISYIIVKIDMGKIKDIKIGIWIISIMFAIMFFVTH